MKYLIGILFICFICACDKKQPAGEFSDVKVGMESEQVIKLIGEPDGKRSLEFTPNDSDESVLKFSEMWTYGEDQAVQITRDKVVGITESSKDVTKILNALLDARARGDMDAVIGYAKLLGATDEQIEEEMDRLLKEEGKK